VSYELLKKLCRKRKRERQRHRERERRGRNYYHGSFDGEAAAACKP
jgi:hypothetical protein